MDLFAMATSFTVELSPLASRFLLRRQKKAAQRKGDPRSQRKPGPKSCVQGGWVTRSSLPLLTQTLPALKPWPPNFVRLAPQWGFGASSCYGFLLFAMQDELRRYINVLLKICSVKKHLTPKF
jgi:hypothetical protein